MNVSLDSSFDVFKPGTDQTAVIARGDVVNRTHRVVRARAKAIEARKSRARELMLPMILCSSLLLLIAFAVWSGWYQSAAETMQTDVAAVAAADADNHYLVALLWFVPIGLAVLATVLYRRTRNTNDRAGL